jgi:hypothetical protein
MPPTIYDSSLLTQRNRTKAVSGSFLNRIASNNTSYAPALGIWDQSIVNSVKNGQMKYFRKGSPIDNGCPCVSVAPVAPVICPSIMLSNIATFDGYVWNLNNDVTILQCQTLEIPSEFTLLNNEYKIINNGTIINNGLIKIGNIFTNNGTINNIGTIDNSYGTVINNGTIYNYNNGTILNDNIYTENGTLNNADGTSTCGTGTLTGLTATGNVCPP